ncbi:MAG: hypothetical protein JXQ71_10330 [Verrucomicrobia bacterium]|nr:hypothetical protein [Verrucomicrobiota bacterium]
MGNNDIKLDLRTQIDRSVKEGVPGYDWIPEPWTTRKPTLVDNVTEEGQWRDLGKLEFLTDSEAYPDELHPAKPPNKKHGYTKNVHPDSNFRHRHPNDVAEHDLHIAGTSLPAAQYNKLEKIAGENPLGMQRLACVFEWVLSQTHLLLNRINEGLGLEPNGTGKGNPDAYNRAREAYIAFLKDLNNHEPHVRGPRIMPARPGASGYGQAMKWAFIFPAVFMRRIVGAKVIIMWNPHSSSNGIPILH